MVARRKTCLRQLSDGCRAREVGFGRFVGNDKVTVGRLIEGWGEQITAAAAGRHVLAIQDLSEINFHTTAERRRDLGEIGKGNGRGVLAHVMMALDAETDHYLGLVAGSVWTRQGRVKLPHGKRRLEDKESRRWIETAATAKTVLAQAASVTVVADRESDIYAEWATIPGENFHLLTRVMRDRAVAGGGTLARVVKTLPVAATRTVALAATAQRVARQAVLDLRFGRVEVLRPENPGAKGLPKKVSLALVEVIERDPPKGVEAVHWRLLTTHAVADVAAAWQIVDWYKRRWAIEQLFRLMKSQSLKIEDSQLATADGLIKLVAIAAKAAAIIMQLLQARDGSAVAAASAFSHNEIAALDALNAQLQGKTALQKNPHARHSLAWAAWIIAKLGGWDGYPSSKPPGPITFGNGLEYFHTIAKGWALRDLCMP